MILSGKMRIIFKTIAATMACVFLWQQVSWAAGSVLSEKVSTPMAQNSLTLPRLLSGQSSVESTVAVLNDAEARQTGMADTQSIYLPRQIQIAYQYDSTGTKTGIERTYSDNSVCYYDMNERLLKKVLPSGECYIYKEYYASGRIKTIEYYAADGFLYYTETRYDDIKNRMESKILSAPDTQGNIYYKYLNESWNGQGYGRIDKTRRQVAGPDGELSASYSYGATYPIFPRSPGPVLTQGILLMRIGAITFYPVSCKIVKTLYNNTDWTGRIAVCTYYSDANQRLASKTYDTPDANGNIYYEYLNESWDNQDYGRMVKSRRTAANASGELSYTHTYYADTTGRLQTKSSYSDVDFTTLVATYTYANDASNRLHSKEEVRYESGGKTQRYYAIYGGSGVRQSFMIESFSQTGALQASDTYEYTGSRLTKRTYVQYGSGGPTTQATLYPQSVLLGSPDYALTYTVDGVTYTENITLLESDNSILRTVSGREGQSVTVEWNLTLDTTAPALGLLSDAYVYDPTYQLRYRVSDANMTATTVTENITLARGLNTFTRQAQDTLGNTRQMTWNIYLDQNAERGLSYDYDAVGNLIRQTTFNGQDINFTYDADNRLSSITYPEYPSVELDYDSIGDVTRLTDSRGNTGYAYDIAGRLSSVILPDGKRLDYGYDLAGRITRYSYAGKAVDYTYDAAGNLTSVVDGANTTTYTYNAAGDLISAMLPNGIRTTYAYDGAANLTRIRHEKGANLIADFTYTLDASGERTRMIETTPASTRTVNYTYDAFKRLTRESDSLYGVINYAYDNAGNRLSKEIIPLVITAQEPRIFTQYTYGIDNRLTNLTEKTYNSSGAELSSRAESFVYDAAGNLRQHITPDKVYYYEFDSRNLLVRFNDGENETTYEYDGGGNRISKTVNGVKTSYLIDSTSSIPQVLAEMDASGNVTKTYAFGLDRLNSTADGTTQYFLQDGLGSSIGLVDSNGVVSEAYSYDAFGNIRSQNASQGFLYTGEQRDAGTGLIYLRARYYDPALGRFISRDPAFIGEQSETQSLNPFIYVQNNPVNYVDPLGLADVRARLLENPIIRWLAEEVYGKGSVAGRHWQIFYNDGTNSGYLGDNIKLNTPIFGSDKSENLSKYDIVIWRNIDDKILKNAEIKIQQKWKKEFKAGERRYVHPQSDCQTYILEVLREATNNKIFKDDDKYIYGNGPGGGGGGDSFGGGFSGTDYHLTGTLKSSPFELGGVYMDKALSIIGENIQDIHGLSYDPLTGQIIMLSDTGTNVPEIPVDYFLAALKAVFGTSAYAPGVSIYPVMDEAGNIDLTKDQNVRFLGGIENSSLGKAVYEADLLMKLIGLGSDNITDTNIRPNGEDMSEAYISEHIPGFKDIFSLCEDVEDPSIITQNSSLRFWFVPNDMKLIKSGSGNAFIFDTSSVKLMTETGFISEGSPQTVPDDPRAVAFAQFFNDHFAEFAALYPEFRELEKGMRAAGLAKFIKDNNIPVDLEWLSKASLPSVTTPATTPLAFQTKTITIHDTGQQVTLTMAGGVDYSLFDGQNFQYLLDTDSQVSGLHDAAQESRESDTTQSWSVTINGTTYQASAFSLAPTKKDGNFSWSGTDLSYASLSGMPLIWQRYYDSFESGNPTRMGSGWYYTPYEIHFPIAKTQLTLEGTTDTVTAYPYIYLSDRPSRGAILFKPEGTMSGGRLAYFAEDGNSGIQALIMNADDTYTLVRGGNNINFASDGRLTTIVDNNLNTVEYTYGTDGKLTGIIDSSSGRDIDVTYGPDGRISNVTGPDGRSVSYTYDTANNDLIKVTQDWSGRFFDMAYDSDHRMLTGIDSTGRKLFDNTYDILGRLTSRTGLLGVQTDINSNLLDQATLYTNISTGAITGYTYDDNFRITSSVDSLGNVTQYQYEGDSFNPQSVIDPKGNTRIFEYDQYGNVISVTDSLGNTTGLYYRGGDAGDSRLTFVEKANGYGTYYDYDEKGNIKTMVEGSRIGSVNPDGSVSVVLGDIKTDFTYDPSGKLVQVKDATNRVTNYAYDDAGNVIQADDGAQNISAIEYATRNGFVTGLVSNMTDALGRAVTFGYDAVRDLITSITTAMGTTQYTYDSSDRQTEVIDGLGCTTRFEYNTKDQLTGVVERGSLATTADDIIASFGYNALGQFATIADPLGSITRFAYDLAGRVVNLCIGEDTKDYVIAEEVNIADVEEDTADITFTVDSSVSQATVFYKKKTDTTYQSLLVSNITSGENHITLESLSGDTSYDIEIKYQDSEGDVSYSRKYDFKTKVPELPVITSSIVQSVSDTTASIKIGISKEIRDARITYHVRGETVNITVLTQDVRDALTDGLVFNLENLRSGQDYDAEITITDRFGVVSEVKDISFKTNGELSEDDSATHGTPRFGRIISTRSTQAYISLENDNITDPFVESYSLSLYDSQGNFVSSMTLSAGTSSLLGRVIVVGALSPNYQYTYTLTTTSRPDILPVSGGFRTSPGGDTTSPYFEDISAATLEPKSPTSMIFTGSFTEKLSMFGIKLIDQVTQAIKNYFFFDIPGNIVKMFLLDGLDAGREYALELLMLDTSSNYTKLTDNTDTYSTPIFDYTPPAITENTVTNKTNTTFTTHITTNELLKKLIIRYRIISSDQWMEEVFIPSMPSFDLTISDLLSGQSYEYQYVLEDNSGNQLMTEWWKM